MPAEPELVARVINAQRSAVVDTAGLERFLRRVGREVPPTVEAEVGARLVSDRTMRQTNLQYRGIDKTTDVLAFPADSQLVEALPDERLDPSAISWSPFRPQPPRRGKPGGPFGANCKPCCSTATCIYSAMTTSATRG